MVGKKVVRYKILKQIGIGGYGEIYQAFDTKLKRTVAVKFIRGDRLRNSLNIASFASEARLAAVLDHPNICAVLDYDYFEKSPFIVMQYVQGLTIRQAVNKRPLKINTALRIAVQLTDALAYAHSQGIVHRDIKPGNVMVTRTGTVKILDFGVARRFGDSNCEEDDLPCSKAVKLTERRHTLPLNRRWASLLIFAPMFFPPVRCFTRCLPGDGLLTGGPQMRCAAK